MEKSDQMHDVLAQLCSLTQQWKFIRQEQREQTAGLKILKLEIQGAKIGHGCKNESGDAELKRVSEEEILEEHNYEPEPEQCPKRVEQMLESEKKPGIFGLEGTLKRKDGDIQDMKSLTQKDDMDEVRGNKGLANPYSLKKEKFPGDGRSRKRETKIWDNVLEIHSQRLEKVDVTRRSSSKIFPRILQKVWKMRRKKYFK